MAKQKNKNGGKTIKKTEKKNTRKISNTKADKNTKKNTNKTTNKNTKKNTYQGRKLSVSQSKLKVYHATDTLPEIAWKKGGEEKRKGGVLPWVLTGLFAALFLAAVIGVYYVWSHYTVTTIYVEGNLHYTNDEIIGMVMEGPLDRNSLYLSFRYRDKSIEDIPFIQKMDVQVVSPTTVRIVVYEKALAGYVEYLGRYMYFDKDGIVVETSEIKTKGIPMVTGLEFDHVILHEKLPVENDQIFEGILDITQMLTKYHLAADRIYFDKSYAMTLYFEEVKVKIGSSDMIDEKIMKLQYILPDLEGKKGTLRMESYTQDSRNITFELD